MKPAARKTYHAILWPRVCKVQKWNSKDDALRRQVVACCLAFIHPSDPEIAAQDEISSSNLDDAHTTALFCYLTLLADPYNITKIQRWEDCKRDYLAFHKSKVADYWQERAYGRDGRRIIRQRFDQRPKAEGEVFGEDALTRDEAEQRLQTFRSRARSKERKATRQYQLQ